MFASTWFCLSQPLIGAMWVKLADQGSADYLWKENIVGYILLIPGNRVQS